MVLQQHPEFAKDGDLMFGVKETPLPTAYEKPDTSRLYRLFFDIEGSLTYTGDVIQLAYLLTDWDFNIIKSYCKYYRNFVPITEDEFKVHGLTAEFLWANAGHHFSLELPSLDIFHGKNMMHVTYSSFDLQKMNWERSKQGMADIDFGVKANSLKTLPKKVNNFDALEMTKGRALQQSTTKEQKQEVVDITRGHAHDALYDTYLLYVLCRDYCKNMP